MGNFCAHEPVNRPIAEAEGRFRFDFDGLRRIGAGPGSAERSVDKLRGVGLARPVRQRCFAEETGSTPAPKAQPPRKRSGQWTAG